MIQGLKDKKYERSTFNPHLVHGNLTRPGMTEENPNAWHGRNGTIDFEKYSMLSAAEDTFYTPTMEVKKPLYPLRGQMDRLDYPYYDLISWLVESGAMTEEQLQKTLRTAEDTVAKVLLVNYNRVRSILDLFFCIGLDSCSDRQLQQGKMYLRPSLFFHLGVLVNHTRV